MATSIPLKDEMSSVSLSTKDRIAASQVVVSLTVLAKDQTSTLIFPSKDEITASPVRSYTNLPTKDQTTSSAVPAKDETTKTSSVSSSVPVKDQSTSGPTPMNDQTSTSALPAKDETQTTSEYSSTNLSIKDATTSSSTDLKDRISTSTTPDKGGTIMFSMIISSTIITARQQTGPLTLPLKGQTSSSSIAAKDATVVSLASTSVPWKYVDTSTLVPLKDQKHTSSLDGKDEMTTSLATTALPSHELAAAASSPVNNQTIIYYLPAKSTTMTLSVITSRASLAQDKNLSSALPSQDLSESSTVLPTKDKPAETGSPPISIIVYSNSTTSANISTKGSITSSVFPNMMPTESVMNSKSLIKGKNSTLSISYSLSTIPTSQLSTAMVVDVSMGYETLNIISSSAPVKYFPSLTAASTNSSPTKDIFTSTMSITDVFQASMLVNASLALPIVSMTVVPVDYTPVPLPLSSTSPNVISILSESPIASTGTASAVITLGMLPLFSMRLLEIEELPVTSVMSASSILATITSGSGSLPSTGTITPLILLTITKSSVAFATAAVLQTTESNTISTFLTPVSTPGISNDITSSYMMLSSIGQTPFTGLSTTPPYTTAPTSLMAPVRSGLPPLGPSFSTLRAFNPTALAMSALSLSLVTPAAQTVAMMSPSSPPAVVAPIESKGEISVLNGTSTIIPLYAPGMLGNAYGGGYITTPSIYVVVAPTLVNGVPPGYGYSLNPDGTTIVLSIPGPSASHYSPEDTSTRPEFPKSTVIDVPGTAQPLGSSTSGNGSFSAPLQPDSPRTFQGAAGKYCAVLITQLLGLTVGILIHLRHF